MKNGLAFLLMLSIGLSYGQNREIALYSGAAPGSENWNWGEKESVKNMFNARIVYNLSHPLLTDFDPDSNIRNGRAVNICPSVGFQLLSIDQEADDVAHWLSEKGITAFVLRYRTAHSLTDDPIKEMIAKRPNSDKFNEDIKPIVAMDIADGETAFSYIRKHAAELRISPKGFGIMGFSAGGTISTGVAYNYSSINRPDFVASIYPYEGSFTKPAVPGDAPPLFIAAAADDLFGFDKQCIKLYEDWIAAKHNAELHIYSKGGHRFGMRKQNLPTDNWIDRFYDWLTQQGF